MITRRGGRVKSSVKSGTVAGPFSHSPPVSSLFRLLRIFAVAWRFGLDEFAVAGSEERRWARAVRAITGLRGRPATPRAVRLREALETLGPIFVKFGQLLS